MLGCHFVPRGVSKLLVIASPLAAERDHQSNLRAAVLAYGGREAAVVTARQPSDGSGTKWTTHVHALVGSRPYISAAVTMRFNDLGEFRDTHRFRSLCPWHDALDAPVSLAMLSDASHLCLVRALPWAQRSAAIVWCSTVTETAKVAALPGPTVEDELVAVMTRSTTGEHQLQLRTSDLEEIVWLYDGGLERPLWDFAVLGECVGMLIWVEEERCAHLVQVVFEVERSPESEVERRLNVQDACIVWHNEEDCTAAAIVAVPEGGRGWYAVATAAQCKVRT
jgi:hypothetical protein